MFAPEAELYSERGYSDYPNCKVYKEYALVKSNCFWNQWRMAIGLLCHAYIIITIEQRLMREEQSHMHCVRFQQWPCLHQ